MTLGVQWVVFREVQARPRIALSKAEAAGSLGVSVDFFDEHIAPELRMVRRGRKHLIPFRELERWLDKQADLAGSAA
jgi:excisionase family DNA binding protein